MPETARSRGMPPLCLCRSCAHAHCIGARGACAPFNSRLSRRPLRSPVVPYLFSRAAGLAFAALITGSRLVLPGPALDGASILKLLEEQEVTVTAAVPTVWLGLLQFMETHNLKLTTLKRVVIGGSAVPPSMLEKFEKVYGVEVRHAYGMTEMSPLCTVNAPKGSGQRLTGEAVTERKLKQARAHTMIGPGRREKRKMPVVSCLQNSKLSSLRPPPTELRKACIYLPSKPALRVV